MSSMPISKEMGLRSGQRTNSKRAFETYSPNTLADRRMRDDVTEADKTARIVALQQRQQEIQARLHRRTIGTTVDVLVDGASRRRDTELSGRTSGNTVVNCPAPDGPEPSAWIGRTLAVRIRRAGPHSLWGEVVSDLKAGAPC